MLVGDFSHVRSLLLQESSAQKASNHVLVVCWEFRCMYLYVDMMYVMSMRSGCGIVRVV